MSSIQKTERWHRTCIKQSHMPPSAFFQTNFRFRSLFAIVSALFLSFTSVAVQKVTLAWQPSATPGVIGYNIYFGLASGQYSSKVTVTNETTGTVTGLIEGSTYYFAVTVFTASGQSLPSNEVAYVVPGVFLKSARTTLGGLPNGLAITSTGAIPFSWVLESTDDFKTWKPVAGGSNSMVNVTVAISAVPRQLYRVRNGSYSAAPIRLAIAKTSPPGAPVTFTISSSRVAQYPWVLESTADFKTWTPVMQGSMSQVQAVVSPNGSSHCCFRLKSQ